MAKKKKGLLGGLIKFAKDIDKGISTSKTNPYRSMNRKRKKKKGIFG